jgi:alanyl aminopeptidase
MTTFPGGVHLKIIRFLPICALLMYSLEAEAPRFRLGDATRPTRYLLELTIVPDAPTFSGTMDIELELRTAASEIWLHAHELTIRESTLIAGNDRLSGRIMTGGKNLTGFAFGRPVQPGGARLHIKFEGKFNDKSSAGLFKIKEEGYWYVFTQFEPIDARSAFPCFDEPSFKAPWRLTLHVKGSHTALSNTPIISETPEPEGMKTVRFGETKPLPSYLIAMAVGPFELVGGGTAGKKHTPIRIITPRGKSAEAAYAKEITPHIVEELENYFGTPFPYEKLDSIAVPLFGEAMENAGLVTFEQTSILAKPDEDSIQHRRGYASVAAHEFAHQWFGDLVTTAWWDDIWLNEAFASWMGDKIVDKMRPDWKVQVDEVSGRSRVMNHDSLVSARKIRQPIESNDDISNAFDGITYTKGETVIRAFENWIGPETFQKGIRLYLDRYSWGNATAHEFLAAISEAAGKDVEPAFSSFLNQAGAPLVTAALRCTDKPRLVLSQERALPLGSQGSSHQTWQIPVCVRFGGDTDTRQCALMTSANFALPLERCPNWMLANEGEIGYYRVRYQGDLLDRLLKENDNHLTLAERVGVLDDVEQLARMGKIPATDALALLPRFRQDPEREIVEALIEIAGLPEQIIPDSLRPNYARFIRQVFGDRAKELGWSPKPGESEDRRLLRRDLVPLVAIDGEDQALIEEATRLAQRWLGDRKAADPDLVGPLLRVAARLGDKELFQKFYAAAKQTQDLEDKERLVSALGGFQNPALANTAMNLVLTDDFDARISFGLLFGPAGNPKTRDLPFVFVQQHYDALRAKLPSSVSEDDAAFLPYVGGGYCDEEHRAEIEAFFKDRATHTTGGPRVLAQVLEQVHLCSARREAQQAGVVEFLRNY